MTITYRPHQPGCEGQRFIACGHLIKRNEQFRYSASHCILRRCGPTAISTCRQSAMNISTILSGRTVRACPTFGTRFRNRARVHDGPLTSPGHSAQVAQSCLRNAPSRTAGRRALITNATLRAAAAAASLLVSVTIARCHSSAGMGNSNSSSCSTFTLWRRSPSPLLLLATVFQISGD